MENFELKAYRKSNAGEDFLKPYFVDVLCQTDTYFKATPPQRLKLREEQKRNYVIRYDRENEAKERTCIYDFYEIKDVDLFKKVFCASGALTLEIVVKKKRALYLYKNARIHIDTVDGIDDPFIEIEVVIRTPSEKDESQELMKELIEVLDIKQEDKIDIGYREILMEHLK